MADQKVSDLPSLNGADVDAADLLYIVDSSAGSAGSKKITVGQYQLAPVSGGTANGVAYLNGSKVVTTGSGLVFDGTNLSTTGTATATKLIPTGGSATGNGMYLPAANTLAWSNNGAETMRLDSSGNLGVGTNSPGARLETVASGSAVYFSGGDSAGARRLQFNATTTTNTGDTQNINALGSTGVLAFSTNSTERARITSGGDLLVGLSAATFVSTRLEVQAATNNNALGSKTTQNNYAPLMAWNSATTGDNLFQYFYTEGTLTLRGSIDYNRAGGLVRYNTTSDYRAKDIIGPITNSGEVIDSLKVYEGKMKGATQSRPMLIAHEAQAHAPYAVSGVKDEVNEDGSPKFQQMDVSSLVPLLLAEIQSLRARVAALESA